MKIGFLGAGAWGFCLSLLLAANKHQVISWTTKPDLAQLLNQNNPHPFLPGFRRDEMMSFTTNMAELLNEAEFIVESVTSAGLRSVFEKVKSEGSPLKCPIVITSKGIEQNSGLILPDVVIEVLGEEIRSRVGVLSGPSFAQDVIRGLPTSVVASAYNYDIMMSTSDVFTTPTFRVYPNGDILGVAYGGALKNIIGIACGIAEGLELGASCKAALMTRGLHEIRKLAVAKGCKAETLNGLAGMGDLCLTCNSTISRNFRYGTFIAKGMTPQQAQKQIGMVVEGVYTCVSALQLSEQMDIPMPITEAVYKIIYEDMKPSEAVYSLMQRTIKEEHL